MSNDIDSLRRHLFETIESLKDDKNPMEVQRAKAIADVAGHIIDTAKVEVSFIAITGGEGTGFIHTALPPPADDTDMESGPDEVTDKSDKKNKKVIHKSKWQNA